MVKHRVTLIEKNATEADVALTQLDSDIGYINEYLDYLERFVENLDNSQRKNNIKLRGLKENIKGAEREHQGGRSY